MDLLKIFILTFVFAISFCIVLSEESKQRSLNEEKIDHIANQKAGTGTTTTSTKAPIIKPSVTGQTNKTSTNSSDSKTMKDGAKGFFDQVRENKGMLLRTLYVLIGVTSVVVLYFVVRAWRVRRRRNRSRKYGLITSRGSDLEMAPLDADDEDDDMTLYEMNGKK